MVNGKNTERKSKVAESVIANPAVIPEETRKQKEPAKADPRRIVAWSGEENTLPYYLL